MRTQGTHYPFTLIIKMPEKWLRSTCGKSDKNNLRIISKPDAYLETMFMTKTSVKKSERISIKLGGQGGVAHTKY